LFSLLSNRFSTWAVIHGHSIPAEPPPLGSGLPRISKTGTIRNLSPVEVRYSFMLSNALSHHRASEAIVPSPSRHLPSVHQSGSRGDTPASQWQMASGRQKFSLIRDVQSAQFYDIVGEVVKTFPSGGSAFEVYVSDYTPNENLFKYEWTPPSDDHGGPGDEYGYIGRRTNQSWPGPYGKLTLRVTLWPPHSTAAQSTIKEGDYVELRNVHIKFDQHHQLEGAVHEDRRYPDSIQVRRITDKKDERYLEVLKRKRSYGKKEVGKFLKTHSDDSGEGNGTAQKRPRKRGGEEKRAMQKKRESPAQEGYEARDLTRKRHKEEETQN
jgi:protection-of-telomeres protein 1